jgi:hypothetical protein
VSEGHRPRAEAISKIVHKSRRVLAETLVAIRSNRFSNGLCANGNSSLEAGSTRFLENSKKAHSLQEKGNYSLTPKSDSFWILGSLWLTIGPGERARLGRTTTRLAG